jgi:uncharacterized protein (TIGR03118 family)
MKKFTDHSRQLFNYVAIVLLFAAVNTACKKYDASPATSAVSVESDNAVSLNGFKQVNLVADKAVFGAARIDHNLQNAWGMSADDEGEIWVSANETGLSFVYGPTGQHLLPPVLIPSHDANVPGNPTGNIYNSTSDFIIPGTNTPAEFVFAEEGGTVSAWNDPTGSTAVVVADRTAWNAVYKGVAIANDAGANFIYVANFGQAKIDVFDKDFNYVTNKSFTDPNLPQGYAPFNIRNIHNMLFVTYALQKADHEDDSSGVGFGFVDIYRANGKLVKRFASQGTLNSPWGITEAKPGVCGNDNAILIGNFGDGRINVFGLNGNFKGQLTDEGIPVAIEGLWAIDTDIPGITGKRLYFTSGPNDESDGIFGFLQKQ